MTVGLRAELRATLDAIGLADSPWLGVDLGERPSPGTWTTVPRLVADGGRGLELLATSARIAHPGLDARHVWRSMVGVIGWPSAEVNAVLVRRARRLVRTPPADVVLRLRLDGAEAGVDGLWWRGLRLAVLPADPLAGHPDVDVVDEGELHRLLVVDLVALLAPVVDAVQPRARCGRRGLWASVFDCVVHPFAAPGPDDASADDQRRRVERLRDAAATTPLDHRPSWVVFEHAGRTVATLHRAACCIAHEWPAEMHHRRADGLDPRWDRYCTACPLIPESETVHRARHRLAVGGL